MKQLFLTAIVTMIFLLNAGAQTWNCGYPNETDVTATIINDTLVVSGIGNMKSFEYNQSAPWRYNNFKVLKIQEGVTSIGSRSFQYCYKIEKVSIANSVVAIGESAFESSFEYSANLSVAIPKNVETIGLYAFLQADVFGFLVDEENPSYSSIDGIIYNKAKTNLHISPHRKSGTVIIPNTVTKIEEYAFAYSPFLSEAILGNNVEYIGESAFVSNTALTSITFPGSLKTIDRDAFSHCLALRYVTFGGNITSLGRNVFEKTAWLNNRPDGAIYVDKVLCKYKSSQSNVNLEIQEGTVSIAPYALENSTGLNSVVIPNSVTTIGECAFMGCDGLRTVSIGNKTAKIGDYAFWHCNSLVSVTCLNKTPPQAAPTYNHQYVFRDVNLSNVKLYVPAESIETYRTADIWKMFGLIEAASASSVNTPNSLPLVIYPTVTTGTVFIENPTKSVITVHNNSGVLLISSTEESIDLYQYPQGVYFVKIKNYTQKIIKK